MSETTPFRARVRIFSTFGVFLIAACKSGSAGDDTEAGASTDTGSETDPAPTSGFVASFFDGTCTGIDADRHVVGFDAPTVLDPGVPRDDEFGGLDAVTVPSLFIATLEGVKQAVVYPKDLGQSVLPLVDWALPSPSIRGGRVLGIARPLYPTLPSGCDLAAPGCPAPPSRDNAAFFFDDGKWESVRAPGDVILAFVASANSAGELVGAFRVDDAAGADDATTMTQFRGAAHDVAFSSIDSKVTVLPGTDAVALDVDASGRIVGKDAQADFDRAVIWRDGLEVVLDHEARDSIALAMSDGGAIVGAVAGSDHEPRAAVFSEGGVTLLHPLGDERSVAQAITRAGAIFGRAFVAAAGNTHAFVIENGSTVDLNPTDASGVPFTSSTVEDVTDDGLVAIGSGTSATGRHQCIVWVRK